MDAARQFMQVYTTCRKIPTVLVHNPQQNNVSLEFHKAVTFYRTVINDVPHDHLASPTVFQSQQQ